MFIDDISIEYAAAQSLLFKVFGRLETGHKTVGHVCVCDETEVNQLQQQGSLLYGELLPAGLNKVCYSLFREVFHLSACRHLVCRNYARPMQRFCLILVVEQAK